MFGVVKRMFLDRWRSLIIYVASSLLFTEIYIALFPAMKEQFANIEDLLEAFPKEVMEAFGYTAETMMFSTIEALLATEMFNLIWPIILIIMTASLANYSFAGDIEKGTIGLTLAQPISRLRIFITRYFAGVILIALFVVATIYGIVPLLSMHNIDYNLNSYNNMAILGFGFGLAFYSLAVFFSTIFSEKGKAVFAFVGTVITMYAINIFANLEDRIELLRYGTFFHYFDPAKALVRGEVAEYALLFFFTFFFVFTLLSMIRFLRRDIMV